jgi:hypothetical protein
MLLLSILSLSYPVVVVVRRRSPWSSSFVVVVVRRPMCVWVKSYPKPKITVLDIMRAKLAFRLEQLLHIVGVVAGFFTLH